jgi:hypothetical protein
MKIKHKIENWEKKCHGLIFTSTGDIKFVTKDSVNENFQDFKLIESDIDKDFRLYNVFLSTNNYDQGQIIAIIGNKFIFDPDPFKSYIELFEGGEPQVRLAQVEIGQI